jgi:aryl-alcohol dehydrogenase-like predicted oxidoreductase
MKYLKNKNELSRLGLGCMRMSFSDALEDREKSIATIRRALESGVNFLNTGDFYGMGHNERLVGEAVKTYGREKFFISVKFGALMSPNGQPYGIDSRPLPIKNYLAYSLKRLGVDYIDLYQPSRIDPEIPVEETVGPIAEMVQAGYVKHIGLSEVDGQTLKRAYTVHPISLVELEYSLFNRAAENDTLPTARELGVDVVAFGVLSHGMLSKERIEGIKKLHPQFPAAIIMEKNLSFIENLREIADEKQITVQQLLISWVLAQGDDIMALVGARTVSQVQETVKALDINLNKTDLERIENVVPKEAVSGRLIPMKFKNGFIIR